MKYLNLQQGTREWLTHRASAFNASEAPAMLGLSPYTSRQALLREKHTGIVPEITDAGTLARFARGHEAEAQLRPLIEQQIGDELYPVVGMIEQDGIVLSASFDGLTMDETTAFEHKLWNQSLADFLTEHYDLPETHWPQVEHQILVSGCESVLFSVSDGTLEQHVGIRYQSQSERRERVLNGWAQFAKDLAAFAPQPEVIPAAAEPIGSLPALFVQAEGRVLANNLPQFRTAVASLLESIKTELDSDQDFADAEAMVKHLKDGETRLAQVSDATLAQTASLSDVLREMGDIAELMRQKRLMLEKLVKAEKDRRKLEIVVSARQEWDAFFSELNRSHCKGMMAASAPNFADVTKGKKLLSSMADAVRDMLAAAKIDATQHAERIQAMIDAVQTAEAMHLFHDLPMMAAVPPSAEAMAGLIAARKAAEQAQIQARVDAEIAARKAAEQAAPPVAAPSSTTEPVVRQEPAKPAKATAHGSKTTTLRITHQFNDGLILSSLQSLLAAHGLPVESVEIIQEQAA